jgi:hypothetical protein
MRKLSRLAHFTLAAATAALAAPACQRGSIGGDTPDALDPGPATPLNMTGRWAMFRFEDPVAVDIKQKDGGVLEGQGCCGGFSDVSYQLNCCAALTGAIAGRHATFGFTFNQYTTPYPYDTDVYVSDDFQRMAGVFQNGYPVTWVRIGATDANLPYDDSDSRALTDTYGGAYTLLLADDPAPGTDFTAQRTYWFNVGGGYVYGELGAFWSRELRWNAADQTLRAGPVPATAPTLPVSLTLHFDADGGTALTSVDAVTASGLRYHFQAMPRQ